MLDCDMSALMKLYVNEAGAARKVTLVQAANSIFVADLTWVEMRGGQGNGDRRFRGLRGV